MGIVNKEDIIGYKFDDEIVCHDCMGRDDHEGLTSENLILKEENPEALIFCDRCKEEITG